MPSGGGAVTARAGTCTLGGASGGGYVLTIRAGPRNAGIATMPAVAETYTVIPDDAIAVLPV